MNEEQATLLQQIRSLYEEGFTVALLRNPITLETKDLVISIRNDALVIQVRSVAA